MHTNGHPSRTTNPHASHEAPADRTAHASGAPTGHCPVPTNLSPPPDSDNGRCTPRCPARYLQPSRSQLGPCQAWRGLRTVALRAGWGGTGGRWTRHKLCLSCQLGVWSARLEGANPGAEGFPTRKHAQRPGRWFPRCRIPARGAAQTLISHQQKASTAMRQPDLGAPEPALLPRLLPAADSPSRIPYIARDAPRGSLLLLPPLPPPPSPKNKVDGSRCPAGCLPSRPLACRRWCVWAAD